MNHKKLKRLIIILEGENLTTDISGYRKYIAKSSENKCVAKSSNKNQKVVNKIDFIKSKCFQKEVLDLGCVRHSADFSLSDPNWLHKHIENVAKSVIGFDYLFDEVKKLKNAGWNDILYGDVTKKLDVDKKFDVIIAGDLIEHLDNFNAFFSNIQTLLKKEGVLIITTPNPFYIDSFFHTSFKNSIMVNPEHVCWIDPQCMKQLLNRYSLEITELHWLDNNWKLKNFITKDKYDIFTGTWEDNNFSSKMKRKIAEYIFSIFYFPIEKLCRRSYVKYSDYIICVERVCEVDGVLPLE